MDTSIEQELFLYGTRLQIDSAPLTQEVKDDMRETILSLIRQNYILKAMIKANLPTPDGGAL